MGFFLRLTAVPRSTLRLRHARPSNVYPRRRCEQGGSRGRGGEVEAVTFTVGIECNSLRNSPRPPCFPNSAKVSHVCAHKVFPPRPHRHVASLRPARFFEGRKFGATPRPPPLAPTRRPASKRGGDEIALIKILL